MIVAADSLSERRLEADVVIVGAGINGTVLATALAGGRRRVLLLEAGVEGTGEPWRSEVTGQPFAGAIDGRRRGYGGTGAWWAGQCAPFDPLDLEARSWVPHSGWPISWRDLSTWHAPAAELLGIRGEAFDDRQWSRRGVRPLPTELLPHKFSVFLPRPDIAKLLRPQLQGSSNVTSVLGAPVVEVVRHPTSERVGGVEVALPSGDRLTVRAPVVVVAAGGVETPRLLLSSTSRDADGMGNRHDNVGRFLHDHPSGIAARVEPLDRRRLSDLYGMLYAPRSGSRVRSWARIPLSAALQRDHGLVGATSNVVFDEGEGPLRALKQVVRHRRQPHGLARDCSAAQVARDALTAVPALPQAAWRRFGRGLSPATASAAVWLRTAAEQPPRRDSRVTLSGSLDANGAPLALIDWRLGDEERDAQRALVADVGRAWRRAGLALVHPLPWLDDEDDDWRSQLVDAYHHSGTTRMSASPRTGVVDADLQCHEVPGLYVAGSGVFPTSSHANPTFTSVALSLRLARHLTSRGAA